MIYLYSLIGFLCCLGVFWGVWASNHFLSSYDLSGVAQILPQDMSYMIFAVALPIILLLLFIAIMFFAISNYMNRRIFLSLLNDSKTEMASLQTLSKAVIEVRKLGFTNQFFLNLPIILNDISICLSEIIFKTGMASDVVIFDALSKNGDNRLYAMCKIILDLRESTPHFDENLRRKVKKDSSVAGAIAIFSSKYNKLLKVLKNYDLDGFVYSLMEEGALGKVNNILNASISSNYSVNSNDNVENDDSFEFNENKETEKLDLDSFMKIIDDSDK